MPTGRIVNNNPVIFYRCTISYSEGDGGITTDTERVRDYVNMRMLKDEGYKCVAVFKNGEEQPC